MKVFLSAPSKTFLLGEYSVLTGGVALLVATQPRFFLEVDLFSSEAACEGIHPNSPAGKWMRSNSHLFQRAHLRFFDPHGGQGGLGASSAQFLTSYIWGQMATAPSLFWTKESLPSDILRAYLSIDQLKQENIFRKSGADVLTQWQGGVVEFQSQPFGLRSYTWPFARLRFSLWRTKTKVSTHLHLAEISFSSNRWEDLKDIAAQGVQAFKRKDEEGFILAVNHFNKKMKNQELTNQETQSLVEQLKSHESILGAKGCGAMGADIILLLHYEDNEEEVFLLASQLGLTLAGKTQDLDEGLRVEIEPTVSVSSRRYDMFLKEFQ